jgi:hypothetical protein
MPSCCRLRSGHWAIQAWLTSPECDYTATPMSAVFLMQNALGLSPGSLHHARRLAQEPRSPVCTSMAFSRLGAQNSSP